MVRMRAGRYEVRDESQLLGHVSGDYVIGFRAVACDGSTLRMQFADPFQAAQALQERHDCSPADASREVDAPVTSAPEAIS